VNEVYGPCHLGPEAEAGEGEGQDSAEPGNETDTAGLLSAHREAATARRGLLVTKQLVVGISSAASSSSSCLGKPAVWQLGS
jgi:hypothetical protein